MVGVSFTHLSKSRNGLSRWFSTGFHSSERVRPLDKGGLGVALLISVLGQEVRPPGLKP